MDKSSFHSIASLFLVIDRIGKSINRYRDAVHRGTEKRLFIFDIQRKATSQELSSILEELHNLESEYQSAFADAKEPLILYMFEAYPALVEYPRLISETIAGLQLHARIYLKSDIKEVAHSEYEKLWLKRESEEFLNVMDSCSELGDLLCRSFQNNDRQSVSLS